MLVGYARTSTLDQKAGFDAQLRELADAGTEKIFQEQVSAIGERPEFGRALEFVREGDTLVVTKLDRLARSMVHLLKIVDELERKKVTLRILNMGVDTSTPTGRLVLQVLGSIGEFERSMMLERQREGIAKARADHKYKGRKPLSEATHELVKGLKAQGFNPTQIASKASIGRRSVYRILSSTGCAK